MTFGLSRFARALVAALALAAPAAARADVILGFLPASLVPTYPGAASNARFQAEIVLSDAAFANGFALGISNTPFAPFAASTAGLLGFSASITPATRPVQATLASFLTPLPLSVSSQFYTLTLTGGGGGQPVTGGISFNNASSNFQVLFSTATGFSGSTNTDGDFAGCFSAQCNFAGRIAVVVPEPAGLAVLAMGGVALAGVLRRRRRAG